MKSKTRQYAPVGPFEAATGLAPLYIARLIADEVQHYFRRPLLAEFCEKLAARAEHVFARNKTWQQKFSGRRGRAYLVTFMRHWLASLLARHDRALFAALPSGFQIGHPLPVSSQHAKAVPFAKPRVPPKRKAA